MEQTKDFILITPHPNNETETSFNDSYYQALQEAVLIILVHYSFSFFSLESTSLAKKLMTCFFVSTSYVSFSIALTGPPRPILSGFGYETPGFKSAVSAPSVDIGSVCAFHSPALAPILIDLTPFLK